MSGSLSFPSAMIKEVGRYHFATRIPVAECQEYLGGQGNFVDPLEIELDFQFTGSGIELYGEAKSRWALECGRCLERPASDCRTKIEARFAADMEKIEVAEEIRQSLLLSLPYRFFCRPDCKGLCPTCGLNRNTQECACIQ